MKKHTLLSTIVLISIAGNCWAYGGGGGGGGTKSCDKPKFTDYSPAANAEVAAGSNFSFVASKNTYPDTIKVTVKDRTTSIKTLEKPDGTFAVSGKLPDGVKGAYARIAITADAQSNCKGAGGWLVKVKE